MSRLAAFVPAGTDIDLGRLATWAPMIFAVLLVLWLVWRERAVPWPAEDEPAPRRAPPPRPLPPRRPSAPSTAPDLDALRGVDRTP